MNETEPAKRPRVYVIAQQPLDFTPATAFGDVQFLPDVKFAPTPPQGARDTWNQGVIATLKRSLSEYMPGYDYIVPTGNPVKMVMVGAIIAEKGDIHKFLGWEPRSQRYLEYTLETGNVRSR